MSIAISGVDFVTGEPSASKQTSLRYARRGAILETDCTIGASTRTKGTLRVTHPSLGLLGNQHPLDLIAGEKSRL